MKREIIKINHVPSLGGGGESSNLRDPGQKQELEAEVTAMVQATSHQPGQNPRLTIPSADKPWRNRNSPPQLASVKRLARCFLFYKVTHSSPAIPFLGIYPRGRKTYVCAKICWQMFIAALFLLAKKLETPQMSTNRSTDEQAEVHSQHGVLRSRSWRLGKPRMLMAEKQHPETALWASVGMKFSRRLD